MPAPTIIAGPAIATFGGYSYYFEGDLQLGLARETFKVGTSIAPSLDRRLISQQVTLSGRPASVHDTAAKYIPYGVGSVGSLLFANTPLVVWTKAGVKHTWANAAITGLPTFNFSPIAPLFDGDVQFTVLGDSTKELTDAAAWLAVTSVAFADTTFDETKSTNPRYLATWGDWADIESEDGFRVQIVGSTSPKRVANWGVVNYTLTDLTAVCRFIPVGLAEGELYEMLQLQGADAILPGQSLAKAGDDLVISAGGISCTLSLAGPNAGAKRFGLEPLRDGEVEFIATRSWTAGVADPLFTLAFA